MQSSRRLDLYNQIQFNSNKEYQKNKKRLHAVCILEIGSMDIDISSNHLIIIAKKLRLIVVTNQIILL